MSHTARLLFVGLLLGALLAGCGRERVVHYRPFFSDLPDAQHGTRPVGGSGAVDPRRFGGELVREGADGSKELVLKSMQHLIRHLQRELMVGTDDRLFEEQLLSELTREEYRLEGRDPLEAVTDLRAMRDDILILLHRMPLAERSPTVSSKKVDRGRWKLRLTNAAARGLELTELWVVLESGSYKLWWVR